MKTRSPTGNQRESTPTQECTCEFEGCVGCRYGLNHTSPKTPKPKSPTTSRNTGLTPGLSYADAVTRSSRKTERSTGRPSPSQKRDSSTNDVNFEKSSIRDNLSSQMENAMNDKPTLRVDTNLPSVPNPITGPSTDIPIISPRQRWTKEENVALFKCYCEATSKNLGKIKGTYEIWRKNNPDTRLNLNANTLSTQRRLVEKNLTNMEKATILNLVNGTQPENEAQAEIEETEEPVDYMTLDEEMIKMQEELIVRFEHAKMNNFDDRKIAQKFIMHKDNRKRMENMNNILTISIKKSTIRINDLTELNALHYAAAMTLAGVKETKTLTPKHKHRTDEIGDEEINKVRKWIGKLTAAKMNNKITPQVTKYLKGEEIHTIIHRLTMKLDALCKRRRTKISSRSRFQSNRLFKSNQKAFYAKLRNGGGDAQITEPPTLENIQNYWGGLFGDKKMHNEKAEWIADEKKNMENVKEATWEDISPERMTKATKKLSNWKAPGLDLVQNFWLKYLHALHPILADLFNETMNKPEDTPLWLTRGRTTLIYKKGTTKEAKNYRPITCLPTYYKLLTLILTDNIYEHVTENDILPMEQKGVRRKARGCKDHLLLDRIITEDAKKKLRDMSAMWIDYMKAYDSIPHSWLTEMMTIYKIDKNTINFITQLMPSWRTRIYLPHSEGCTTTEDIRFLRGIFQGDTLSPLLFCLALAPIRNILKKANVGYKIGETKVSNLLYIDDLKCYAKNDVEMERCRALIQEFSTDIAMTFGLEKCAAIHMKKGKIENSPKVEGIPLLEDEDSYKYLGILQSNKIIHEKSKEKAKNEFLNRVRMILKSELNAKNTTDAIKTYAMPIMRYGFGVLKWTADELRAIDRKVRKILTKGRFHHPKSNTHRLYLSRKEGGRGLIGAADCHRQECTKLAEYLSRSKDPFSKIICQVERTKKHGILSYLNTMKEGSTEDIDREHAEGLKGMELHGQYFDRMEKTPNINLPLSRRWLEKPYLRFETESLLCAAQEQALATNYTRSKIWGNGKSGLCRLCKEQNETVHHIVSGCKMLCGTQYTYRHNQVAKYIHWQILKDLKVKVSDSWLKHTPTEVVTKNGIKVLWDSYLLTDKKVPHNRPDIVVHDTTLQECLLIDVAIPVCMNIVKKEAEKITKYRDLEIEIQKCWNLKKIRTIPVVIGALGSVTLGMYGYLENISKNLNFDVIQRTAIMGSAHILRNFLTPIEKTTK